MGSGPVYSHQAHEIWIHKTYEVKLTTTVPVRLGDDGVLWEDVALRELMWSVIQLRLPCVSLSNSLCWFTYSRTVTFNIFKLLLSISHILAARRANKLNIKMYKRSGDKIMEKIPPTSSALKTNNYLCIQHILLTLVALGRVREQQINSGQNNITNGRRQNIMNNSCSYNSYNKYNVDSLLLSNILTNHLSHSATYSRLWRIATDFSKFDH